MARLCYVYALGDPRTDEIRYVGRSVQPEIRLRDHMRKTAPNGNRSRRWLHALKRRGLRPVFWILEVVPNENHAGKRETWWIHYFWRVGARLANETDSGEHGGGWNRGLTKETDHRVMKAATSIKARWATYPHPRTGHPCSAETKEKISSAHRGRKKVWSAEGRQRFSEYRAGRPGSMAGKTHSVEARAKMSARKMGNVPWNKGKTKTDDPRIAAYGERGGKVRAGRTHSEIHKQRIGESLKKAYGEGRHVRPKKGPTRKC